MQIQTRRADPQTAPGPAMAAPWQHAATVLVVDPDPDARQVLSRALEIANPQLTLLQAANGQETVEMVDTVSVDCVVVEAMLPDQDPLALVAMLRNTEDLSAIPAIVMTNRGSEALAADALRVGVADYLQKDATTGAELAEAVRRAIESHHLQRALDRRHQQMTQQMLELERRHEQYQSEREEMAQLVYTPLASIQEFVSLVLDGVAGPLSDTQGKYLAYARGACRQLQRSVESMLLSGQLESSSPSRKQWCDLEALIEQTVEGFELDARARQVNVGYAIEGVLPQVRLDPHEFRQVLSALMNHALNARHENGSVLVTADFTRKGTDSVTVNVAASLSLLPATGEPAVPNAMFSEIFCKGPYVIETRFNDGLQFSFNVPINGYSK